MPFELSYKLNGVKFDGVKNGVLLDAKSGYAKFIDPQSGTFYSWFRGASSLVEQAERQTLAAQGMPIAWHFDSEKAMRCVQHLLQGKNNTITCIFTP